MRWKTLRRFLILSVAADHCSNRIRASDLGPDAEALSKAYYILVVVHFFRNYTDKLANNDFYSCFFDFLPVLGDIQGNMYAPH